MESIAAPWSLRSVIDAKGRLAVLCAKSLPFQSAADVTGKARSNWRAITMTDIAIASDHLNYRVAGVCVHENHVLLHREAKDDFWVMPGGRPRLYESSRDALIREMDEEIATRVEVLRLLWVVENFFEYFGERLHEIAFYYQMSLPEDSPYRDVGVDFTGQEGDVTLLFHWLPIDEIERVRLYPTFLRTALSALPESPVHVIHVDQPDP
jgi:ADP-ribose pyrophosphatase YjhB (NUDIX family)